MLLILYDDCGLAAVVLMGSSFSVKIALSAR